MIRFLWCCVAILLAFSQVLDAIENEVIPSDDSLQIRLDYELYKQKPILFSSRLTLTEEPKISDSQLKTLAVDAYKEMEVMTEKYNFGGAKRPSTMTTLVVGKEIIFASSVKKGDTIELGPETTEHLANCGEGIHKNKGRCGEVMTFDDYYRSNVDGKKLDKSSNARIVAITKHKKANTDSSEYAILDPCGDEKISEDQETTPFNWRQLKKEGNLKIAQSPAAANDGSVTTNQGNTNENLPPKNRLKLNKKPSTSIEEQKPKDKLDSDSNKPPPKNPWNLSVKPSTSAEEQKSKDKLNAGSNEPPPKNPWNPNAKPVKPFSQDHGTAGHSNPDDDNDNNSDGAGKSLKKPKNHGTRTRRRSLQG
ncbi:hypothetical protein QQS21_005711 [Conoideocrella luteorostrata]|uniref:Uncharacterized protein n=1 Tax=Conoideocrella luteorostrata TaxID=1105319 RepID=A0AAJ0FTK3_9HYPO|nr:hypothetical protein QQS21_005711 [Conoideocrella luteorostrata]